MPAALTYPGVYVEELPSGVRPVTGVSTSVTAFVGRALRGPTDKDPESPVVCNSFGDYERIFGGLWQDSTMSFAVRDFFLNGGSQALIVRLVNNAKNAKIVRDGLTIEAATPGAWGNKLRIRLDNETRDQKDTSLFNLTVRDGGTGLIEVFRNVTIKANLSNSLDKVLKNGSRLIRVETLPHLPPTPHPTTPLEDIWNADSHSQGVAPIDEAIDGSPLSASQFLGNQSQKQGIYALLKADIFNLLCISPYLADQSVDQDVIGKAATLCEAKRAFLILDAPHDWSDKERAVTGAATLDSAVGTLSKNAAVFFPRLRMPNPLRDGQEEVFASCGAVAGIFARTDSERGVWKAPAGLDAGLVGVPAVAVPLTDAENGELNPLGVNCIRTMPGAGRVIWGSRTLVGSDRLGSEWKYVPIRRLALYLEESLYRGTQWAVFEPNDAPLWAQLRLNIGAFMQGLFRKGAFAGASPREAYFVKCDAETTTPSDQNLGIVNIIVGYAPLKPAEFVVLKFQQMAGQIAT